ncbi:2OG-Fe dioxygenase family protein, partial [Streptomyces durbertensis]
HWDDLVVDRYAAAGGTRRLRRYGTFTLTGDAELRPRSHGTFVQPDDTNPLYVDVERRFDPLTGAFVADPVFRKLVGLLGALARGLDARDEWVVQVHPFRVIAAGGQDGQPTPEGRHKDGVTLVTSMLVGRENAAGGRSAVYDDSGGAPLLAATLDEPGALLLGDDRRTEHEVSPIRPRDPASPARRDVLVTTLLPTG